MNQITTHVIASVPVSSARASAVAISERVREIASALGCTAAWARAAGRHVILGMGEQEAFARVTPVGGGAFGLSFRVAPGDDAYDDESPRFRSAPRWAPLLLIDALADVVEHALIGEGAIHRRLACM